jgi:hypothetical protein
MAVLLLLLALIGAVLVGDLVVENTAAGGVIALQHSITGYSEGQLLAMAAALGFAAAAPTAERWARVRSTPADGPPRAGLRGGQAGRPPPYQPGSMTCVYS